jgi:hypothetical protein
VKTLKLIASTGREAAEAEERAHRRDAANTDNGATTGREELLRPEA